MRESSSGPRSFWLQPLHSFAVCFLEPGSPGLSGPRHARVRKGSDPAEARPTGARAAPPDHSSVVVTRAADPAGSPTLAARLPGGAASGLLGLPRQEGEPRYRGERRA